MQNIKIENILGDKFPQLINDYPKIVSKPILKALSGLMKLKEINEFIEFHGRLNGFDFIDALFDYLNFTYELTNKCKRKIPAEGKLIIVANHPLGGLDGLALLKAIGEVRRDVKIVANDVLMSVTNLSELFLPFDLYSAKASKTNFENIEKALLNDQAIIIFPAGEVSRMNLNGVKDKKWKKGAIKFAAKFQAPVLPAFVKAMNSPLFYMASSIKNEFGTMLLPRELFKKKNKVISIRFGDPIPARIFSNNTLNANFQIKLLKKHVYSIGKGKKGFFSTEKTIIHPTSIRSVKGELVKSELIGTTSDGKKMFIADFKDCPNVVKEIARLREITFRTVGEGTGHSYDSDIYDTYYKHLVLWDEDHLEIVGSYRLGLSEKIINLYGKEGLYNHSQFELNDEFDPYLNRSIELGRSFISQKYWKTAALDYIWKGIGAYIKNDTDTRYLWGAVSISDYYSERAKSLIVYYYKKWYSGPENLVKARKPYQISKNVEDELNLLFSGTTASEDYAILKLNLKNLGYVVPVLYKRYTELTEENGAVFIGFNIDENFSNSIDGLILVDLHKIKPEYKERYFAEKKLV